MTERTIDRVMEFKAPPEQVWRAISDPAELSQCFGHRTEPDTPFDDAPSTRVEWTLSPSDGGGTTLHLRESGFLTDVHQEQNRGGWEEELGELMELLEGSD